MDVPMLRIAMCSKASRETKARELAKLLGITTTTLYMNVNGVQHCLQAVVLAHLPCSCAEPLDSGLLVALLGIGEIWHVMVNAHRDRLLRRRHQDPQLPPVGLAFFQVNFRLHNRPLRLPSTQR